MSQKISYENGKEKCNFCKVVKVGGNGSVDSRKLLWPSISIRSIYIDRLYLDDADILGTVITHMVKFMKGARFQMLIRKWKKKRKKEMF